MLGIRRLDQDLAGPVAAAGAAGDLHDLLCEALARAEIRAEEPLVRGQHDDERHVREVVALRQHLRAEQDARAAVVDGGQRFFEVAAAPDHVAVDAHERRGAERAASASSRRAPCPRRPGASSLPQRGQAKGSGSSAPQ